MVNKFSSIEFPLFAIKNSPNEVYFDHYEIKVRKTASSHLETVDNKKLSGDYFARLMQIPKRLDCEFLKLFNVSKRFLFFICSIAKLKAPSPGKITCDEFKIVCESEVTTTLAP